ncbi:hypothetical protein [Pedobacter antarcticus]|uniref:hypothetical protein n=1 Tax=Pedobacter antarcticus TaxID=34086 RepID=UPI00292E8972|nr:hypothetical protein [Pedobacter antarcticus]
MEKKNKSKKKITALQVLSEMEKISREIKAPSIEPRYIIGSKYNDKTANGLTKAIITFLNLSGMQAERINNMGRMVDRTKIITDSVGFKRSIGSVEWQKGTGTRGTADISSVIKGLSVKIEVKIGKDVQSDHQKKYEESITQAGGVYLIAKEFGPFVKWYVGKFGRPEIFSKALERILS